MFNRIFLLLIGLLVSITTNAQKVNLKKSFSKDSVHFELVNYFHGPINARFEKTDSFKNQVRLSNYILLNARDSIDNVVAIHLDCIEDTSAIPWKEYFSLSAQGASRRGTHLAAATKNLLSLK